MPSGYRDLPYGEHRTVTTEQPVQIACDGLTGRPGQEHGAVSGWVGSPVRVAVVDSFVAAGPKSSSALSWPSAAMAAGFANRMTPLGSTTALHPGFVLTVSD